MKKALKSVCFACALVAANSCVDITRGSVPELIIEERASADPDATLQTKNLMKHLFELSDEGKTMFGHQCSTLYGIGWSGDENRSDIKSICGDYPAVQGWDLSEIELGKDENIDGDSFALIRTRIIEAYRRGGVTTLSWHTTNPVTGGTAWDNTSAVYRVIPGGDLNAKYCKWLDKVAEFIGSLKDGSTAIPVLFRPYHEHSGNGFWWGNGNCTADEYVKLWRFTLEYLRDTKGLHNILYVYSPDIVSNQASYLAFWPGNDYVDVIGIDAYERSYWSLPVDGLRVMRLLRHISMVKSKPFAFTETGLENNKSVANWWTGNLYASFKGLNPVYVVVWRNKDTGHFFGPYPGCVSEKDFKDFVSMENILMERDINNYIYE